jgi:hypothetical protein
MQVSLDSSCNNKAHIVTVGEHRFFFSYKTCIAYYGPAPVGGWWRFRIANHWGPTTGKHFNQLGCGEFPIVNDDDFNTNIERAMALSKAQG